MNDLTKTSRRPRFSRFLGCCALASLGLTLTAATADAAPSGPHGSTLPPKTEKPVDLPGSGGSDKSILEGDVTWTAVSGDTGSYTKVIGGDNEYQAAYSIRWWEDSDDPCKFQVYTRHINKTDVFKTPNAEFCAGSPGNQKWAERRGKNEYITALKVCLTDKKDSTRNKIKGIRLWGRTLDVENTTLGPQNGPDESRHTNCKEWKKKVSCPSGQVATKIKVYYDEYTHGPRDLGYGFAKGISLGCRGLAEK